MKKSLKRLLCLVLSVLLFTMSLPVLAADTTEETTTETEENTTTETNLQGLDLLETLHPTKVEYGYVIVAKDPDKTKNELTWNDFKEALDKGEVGMSANILLKTDVDLNTGFTFQSTEGSGNVKIAYTNKGQTKIVSIDVNGNVIGDPNSQGKKPTEAGFEKAISSWTPIGTKGTDSKNDQPFTGIFNAFKYDDKGNITGVYTISGLYINPNTASDNVGLFGYIDGAKIAGVRIQDSYIRGKNNVGALVGNSNHSSNIIGCVNGTGSVVIGKENVGGVVGSFDVDHTDDPSLNDDDQDHIYECVNRGYVYGKTNVGGIVGYTYHALIRDSFNMHADTEVIIDLEAEAQADEEKIVHTGYVEGTKYVGGIVGRAVSTVIYGCTNYGVVTGYDSTDENNKTIPAQYVGGIVGQLDQIRSYLREVVNARSAIVTGKEYVGGIVGYLGETETNTENPLELFMAYNHGTVNGTDKVGGLVGYNATRGKVFNSYSSGPVLISDKATDNNGNIVGLNAGEVRDCFYYPNMYAKTVDDNENDLHEGNENAIGNGIGSNSASKKVYHVSGLKVLALKSEAAAYLLNLVYLENDDHNTGAGYHHLATHDFGDTAWTTPTYWMAGKYGPEFTESTSLAAKTIKSAQLFLNENFNLTFKVYVPNGLSTEVIQSRQVTVYQEGTKLKIGDTISAEYKTDEDANGNKRYYYEFTLTDIKPHYLGDKFEVIFTAKYAIPQIQDDGTAKELTEKDYISVSEKREYSVQDYCERQLAKKPTDFGYKDENDQGYINLRTLLCNVLEYGAVYQKYRKHVNASNKLPNEVLTKDEADNLMPTHYWNDEATAPTGKIVRTAEQIDDTFKIYGSLLRFGSENKVGLALFIENINQYDGNTVIVKATYGDTGEESFTISQLEKSDAFPNVYYLPAFSVSITNVATEYTFQLFPRGNNTCTESARISMEAFIASLIDVKDGREDIAAALWDYYYAAKRYAEGDKVNAPDNTTGDITLDTDNIFDADVWNDIKEESGNQEGSDDIPKGYVKLNISDSLAKLLSLINPWIRDFVKFEIVEYKDAWYARPYPYPYQEPTS